MTIRKIDHLAIVVESIDAALTFYRDALGLPVEKVEHVAREEVNVAFLPLGESEIELLEPTSASSGVARYLEKRGAGMHHICVEVSDIDAMLARLREKGIELINPEPVQSADGKRYAFIHPRSAFGVMIELYEYPA